MNAIARSHPGMSGKNNEDRYAVSAFLTRDRKPIPSVFAVVCDGIGGHRAGEVAAEIAVETITRVIAEGDSNHPVRTLQTAVVQASQAIYDQSESDVDQKGMGATCACCWVLGDRLYTINVGDSRIYLIRGGAIRQLTTDHTWIQEALESGAITAEQARGHPNSHVIRRFLGSRQQVAPDTRLRLNEGESDVEAEANQGLRLLPGDQLLLCSDGLTDLISDEEIYAILNGAEQEEALDSLIDLANQRGGHDNITIVSLRMPETTPERAAVPAQPPRRIGWACLGTGAILVAGILLLGGLYYFVGRPILAPSPTVTSTTQPAAITRSVAPTAGTPAPTRTPFGVQSPTIPPRLSATPPDTSAVPQVATLTPWPTNTRAP